MPEPAFIIGQGDLLPAIEAVLQDATYTAVDLSVAQTVTFVMTDRNGAVIVEGAASVVTPLEGRVKYLWQAGDTDIAGNYQAEWRVVFPGTQPMTFPNDDRAKLWIRVGDRLDS